MGAVSRIVFAVSLMAAIWPSIALAQAIKAGVVTNLQGNVTAARAALPQPQPLKFKDDVFLNDRVVTGDRSLARLLLGGRAVVTIRERSALTITEVPGRSTIELDSGKIAVAVAKDRMRPGDQIEVKTPNAIAAVRGTVFVVEVIRTTADASGAQGGTTTNVFTFTGEVLLTVGTQIVTLGPKTFANATGALVNSGPMTQAMETGAWGGLTVSGVPKVNGGQDGARNMAMGSTIATFTSTDLPSFTQPPVPPPLAPNVQQVQNLLLPGGTPTVALGQAAPPPLPGGGGDVLPPPVIGPPVISPPGTVTPDSILRPPPALSPPFGQLAPGGLVTDQYSGLGLMFGPRPVAIFNDPPVAWAGVNANNVVDLLSPVQVSFVTPGTSRAATTNHLSVEVGFAPVGTILLQAFGAGGALLGSTTNDDGIGPHDRTLATLDVAGIRSFLVSGNDTWGMDQISFGDLTESGVLAAAPGSTGTVIGGYAAFRNFEHTTEGSFLRLADGTRFGMGGGQPLLSVSGGVLTIGTGSDGGHLFELLGRNGATRLDGETGLTLGTDQPLQPGVGVAVFDASNGAIVTVNGSAYRVDTAILEATGPLLNLRSGSSTTTASHAVDLVGRAKVSLPNDAVALVSLNASSLTVRNGHLVNVDSSVLSIAGHFLSLSGGSTLNVLNGLLLNASNGSAVSIGGKFINFSGAGNTINITNSIVPTAIINGIPVAGAVDALRIGPNAIAGLGTSGTIKINGVTLTPTTPLSSLTGSLVAVQSGSGVKIGQ
ncbi:MAG: hypothetical protein DME04_12720 [Candidatus Rokuibacteriota bacterium]|nr:MAG: hypothetical protein DME04_12720 [Candidatus Rokubacteria bacterium]